MSEHDPQFLSEVCASEATFQLQELFYSRTDERGVIQAGNTVFQRVAGLDWDALIGAPHRVIRHPDMPRGVFQLLWDRIRAGKPTGAYVKNRRTCGRYYWVFALVAPFEGGYISTRIKPTSALFPTISDCYADLLRREAEGMTPADSAGALRAMVTGMGFASYHAFQAHALATELEARARQLARPMDPLQRRFLEMSKAIDEVQREILEMKEAFKAIRTVPLNMRLIASRLENAGGPISAISVNYSQMLEEMSTWVTTFAEGESCVFARIRDAILNGQFLGFATAVEAEMLAVFRDEKTRLAGIYPASVKIDDEIAEVARHRAQFLWQTADSLREVEQEAKRFARSVLDMKRYVTGLSSTRMMCKIESATLAESGTALSGIVEQLDSCQNEIESRLARVVELNSIVQNNTAMLRSLL
ncbi:PAS domain-containing protein [Ponticoccus litoralis]|uniref:PAS domain-containing protein n=1 Tax=Ponticoccus litoralis TaxID=422297 RepID=A0AAW9SNS4_9RHOB